VNERTIKSLPKNAASVGSSLEQVSRINSMVQGSDPLRAVRQFTDSEYLSWLTTSFRKITDHELEPHLVVPVWLIPDGRFNARVVCTDGHWDIILNQGCVTLLCFCVSFWALSKRVGLLLRNPRLSKEERNDLELGFKDALGLSYPLIIKAIRDAAPLPDLRASTPADDQDHLAYFLVAAEVFLLLHETAHAVLKHAEGGELEEIPTDELWIREEHSRHKQIELEADKHALDVLPESPRMFVASGAHFMLDVVVCHEMWPQRLSTAHPLAANRIQRIETRDDVKAADFKRIYNSDYLEHVRKIHTEAMQFEYSSVERLNIMFGGRTPQFACDFIEWFSSYVAEIHRRHA
jgi:hypothetical protein